MDITPNKINSQLIEAVKNFKTRKAKKLLKKGADPNHIIDEMDKTVLMEAAHSADTSMVKALIDNGADIDLKEKEFGFNAILFACSQGHIATVKALQDAGSDILSLSENKSTCLMHAAYNYEHKIIKFLIDQGVDINAQNEKGQTALIFALAKQKSPFDRDNTLTPKNETIYELIQTGADINMNDKFGYTALSHATSRGDLESVKILLQEGADPNASKYNILLQVADISDFNYNISDEEKEEMIKVLKEYGAKLTSFCNQYKINVDCKECGKLIPLNGPAQQLQCSSCMSFTKLDDEFWTRIFKYQNSYKLEDTCSVDFERKEPLCSKCENELDVSNYNLGSSDNIICKKCAHKNSSFPVPDWMKKYSMNSLFPTQIFCSDLENRVINIIQEETKPIAFQCVSCAAALSISSDTPRNCTCEHCGTTQYLPDPLWLAMHPVKKREKWYILFGE